MKDSKIIDEVMSHLQSFVSLLTPEERKELKMNMAIERFKKNDVIYREGEVPQYMHCLATGKVKLYKEGVGGRTQIMRMMKPYEFFGFRAYMANQNYINNAGAFESCTMCMFPLELLDKWISENTSVALFFIKLLATELGASDERTVNWTQKHIRGRLAEALLFLRDTYGLDEEDEYLAICTSREDLASLSNMTTSNAIRTLSAFQNEDLIEIEGRKIKILEGDSLKKISKIG